MPGIAIGPHLTAPLMLAQTGGQCVNRRFQDGVDRDWSQGGAPHPLDQTEGVHITDAEALEIPTGNRRENPRSTLETAPSLGARA